MLVQVYVDDIIFGSTRKSWCDEFEALMKKRFQMSSMGELTFFLGLQVKQKVDGMFISQDKYVAKILKKFDFMSVKHATTPIETHKQLAKDEKAADVDVHLYRSMIRSLMYLTASRPDIMFAVCACSRFQVTPKTSHLHAVKRIFRYLKGKPKLGLWYPKESSFDLVAYSDSDYSGNSLDRKSTTGGCQFLGHRLISWQCKKQTIVTTSTTEAEYVVVAHCCRQIHVPGYFYWDDRSIGCIRYKESLERDIDGTKVLFLPNLLNFCLTKVNTDSAILVPLGKVSTAKEPLEKIPPRLEKTDGSVEFHEIIDFLTRSSIHYALTVSPVVSTTFFEQFWMSAKSKTINNVKYINAKVAGKPVTILEASIRSDLLFDDADGVDVLNNQAIFDAIQQIGYEGDLTVLTFNKALFSSQWKFFFHTINHCISSKSTSWDQIPTNIATAVICFATNQKYNFSKLFFDGMIRHLDAKKSLQFNALTSKVFSFMVKKGKHFSGKVTPLFPTMLVQPIEDEGEEGFGGNHGGQSSSDRSLSGNEGDLTLQSVYDLYLSLCTQVTAQAIKIKALKVQVKKLKKQARPFILHHKTCLRAVKRKKQQKEKVLKTSKQRRSVSKQGRKSAKTPTSVHKDQAFDDLDNFDGIDYMETDAYKEEGVSTDKPGVSTDQPKVSTDKPDEDTDKPNEVLLNMSQAKAVLKEKEKGVELKDVEDIERPRLTSTRSLLTLNPLPKIDPKDKGKKRIEEDDESDTESDDVTVAEKKFKQTRIEADRLLAVRIQEAEREQFTVEEEQNFFMTPLMLKEDSLLNKDERKIKEMNERVGDPDKKRLKKKVVKEDDTAKPDVDSDDEHRKCLRIVALDSTIDSEVMETKSVIARLNKVSSPDGDNLVIYRANGNFSAFNYLLEVLHIFDRQDLFHLYDLVMEQYSEITLEGIKLILRGDLKIMMESSTEANDQELKDGTVIHMLVERRYPLSLLQRMLDLGLEIKKESTAALHLVKFIKQQLNEE
ncbi:uncharacterized mitochondrial protein-like protein [Tanacetum coccineum]|uniref:Uncharacterized mitochondrial protein-like protein n=1 Tax=Tanacetum coccineum TaxID=301880 RepID=A0ABQ5I4H7_9ASTR